MKYNKTKSFYLYIVIILLLFMNHSIISFALSEEESIYLNSESAILIDATTGEILYEKNSNRLMYPASITKIVTAIVAIEQGNLNDVVTVSENARYVDGTRVYLEIGEKVPLLKLVQGLLINSGNDAGVAIAEHMDGSVELFSERMNDFLFEEIGVRNTTFKNPHGLFDPEHVTTAYDMARITQYAMKSDVFREIVGTKHLKWKGIGWDTIIYNHHQLVRQRDDVIGVKNGFVDQSGFTLVTAAERDHIQLIVVTLKADSANQAYEDTEALLDYGFENYKTNIITADDIKNLDELSQFEINSDIHFTTNIDTQWNSQLRDDGYIIVESTDGQVLFAQKLTSKYKEESLSSSIISENEEVDSVENILFLKILLGVILFLVITVGILFLQKFIRKRKRFF
ncbi:D-alanyl-D-alanine carboxypeptidase family protein [Bacillaceae bacterium W0354]